MEKEPVLLNSMETCAIRYAFMDAETERPEAFSALEQSVGGHFLYTLEDGIPDKNESFSIDVEQMPHANIVFANIAHIGLEQMKENKNYATRLTCEHTIENHRQALESILKKFPVTEH